MKGILYNESRHRLQSNPQFLADEMTFPRILFLVCLELTETTSSFQQHLSLELLILLFCPFSFYS